MYALIFYILCFLGISESFASAHRLYDVEVIELSPHVSFLLILPPVEDVCIIPGQSDTVIEREDLVLLPVQVFEMIHLCTYQTKFISRYSRLSSILEMDIILAQQMQREVSIYSRYSCLSSILEMDIILLNKCKGRLVL